MYIINATVFLAKLKTTNTFHASIILQYHIKYVKMDKQITGDIFKLNATAVDFTRTIYKINEKYNYKL